MAKKKRATTAQLIERARGRARALEKKGLYSKALEELKLRAGQQGINPFTQAKLNPEAKQRQMNIIRQFLKGATSTISGAQRERERSLKALIGERGYAKIPKGKKEKEKYIASLERNLKKERGQLARDADTVTELWNTLKYDLQDIAYQSASATTENTDTKERGVFGGDVYQLITEIEEAGGLPVDFAGKIFEDLHHYLRSDEPITYNRLWNILHKYDWSEVPQSELSEDREDWREI